jgi:hypothetical protein
MSKERDEKKLAKYLARHATKHEPARFSTESALQNAYVEIRDTPDKGRGLFALVDLPRLAVIASYRGSLFTEDERPSEYRNYGVSVGPPDERGRRLVLQSTADDILMPGAHIANHSHESNAMFCEYLGADGIVQWVAVSIGRIKAGEEITVDYGLSGSADDPDKKRPCFCGASGCPGTIGAPSKDYLRQVQRAGLAVMRGGGWPKGINPKGGSAEWTKQKRAGLQTSQGKG